jgi:crotonobetainyl-CoA:carnitine CoA-transferase CaiB-like acyl-CoA transferase
MLPLAGMKVIDLSTVVFGPLAGQILADYGADVIKVEAPEGDLTRAIGPASEPGMAAMFIGVNRNKRGLAIDLKTAEGRAALHRLLGSADVLMHNIRPQKLAAIGLSPAELTAAHPRLVYAALVGFGEDGPYAGNPAFDDIIQGLSGFAALMELRHGQPDYFPTIAADKICAQAAAHAILAALVGRGRSGRGGYVEIPMFETVTAFNLAEHFYGMHFDPPLAAPGYARLLNKWRAPFQTSDGHVCMMPYSDANWRDFFTEAGQPEIAADPRFTTLRERTVHSSALYGAAAEVIRTRSTEEWLAVCRRLDIPAARINSLADLFSDPHLAAVDFFRTVDDGRGGQLRLARGAIRFDGETAELKPPPRLGEHSREVLAEAGFAAAEIDALVAAGAVRVAKT